MTNFDRKRMEAVYEMFDAFALEDQRNYYRATLNKFRDSGAQVNGLRAFFSLLAGLASALAGLIVQSLLVTGGQCAPNPTPPELMLFCDNVKIGVGFLMILAVVAPAVGGAFGTLADLFQWDRMMTIYDSALENIDVADARSPDPEMDDITYRASLRAYVEGTLSVMRDETAQWGQLIRTPPQLDQFIQEEQEKAARVSSGKPAGSASTNPGPSAPPVSPPDPTSPPAESSPPTIPFSSQDDSNVAG
jgi:hypothetical protein